MSDTIRVFLCDDHTLFRQGIRKLLELEGDIKVVGEAGNGQAALDMLKNTGPDSACNSSQGIKRVGDD